MRDALRSKHRGRVLDQYFAESRLQKYRRTEPPRGAAGLKNHGVASSLANHNSFAKMRSLAQRFRMEPFPFILRMRA